GCWRNVAVGREAEVADLQDPLNSSKLTRSCRRARSDFRYRRKRADAGSGSSLRQSRLAEPIKTMLDILGVLVDGKTFPAFNCEGRVDPEHLRGFRSCLLKLSRLRIRGREPKTGPLQVGEARCAFAQPTRRLPIALKHVIGETHRTRKSNHLRLKRIEADVCLQRLDCSCVLARIRQD